MKTKANAILDNNTAILNSAIEAAQDVDFTSSEDAYCGFAWIEIKPARGAFVAMLKKQGIGQNGYAGGWNIWSSALQCKRANGSQSMVLKENVCEAFAKVLVENGINAYVVSRAD
jgi:hypothetical protein